MADLRVAVVGATGAVGEEFLRVMESRKFPVRDLVPLASTRSKGRTVKYCGEEIPVQVLDQNSFKGIELALFSAGATRSREFAPAAVKSDAVVVDNSSAFRMDPEVPLVVPEINAHAIKNHKGIIANPNCSTIIMLVGIAPIHKLSPIKRIVASTYQAASGAGAKAMDVLRREIAGESVTDSVFPHPLAGNLIPRIDTLLENGYTREEMKMVNETIKIMEIDPIPISATCVRVPVERAHSESVQVTTEKPLGLEQIRNAIKNGSGVDLLDEPKEDRYPTPLMVSGKDDVYVGRIRIHPADPNTCDLWIVGDQIRKGAALNAIQIAEILYQ